MRAVQVDVGYACFGIEVHDGRLARAAPIGGWCVGRSERQIREWVARKRGTWTEAPERAAVR